MNFKSTHIFSDRLRDATNILQKYPDRIPVICEKSNRAPIDCPDIDNKKYLVPNDLTISQFIYVIRKRLKLNAEKALFLFINGFVPSGSNLMCNLYDSHKDTDNYLYITYTFENTFG